MAKKVSKGFLHGQMGIIHHSAVKFSINKFELGISCDQEVDFLFDTENPQEVLAIWVGNTWYTDAYHHPNKTDAMEMAKKLGVAFYYHPRPGVTIYVTAILHMYDFPAHQDLRFAYYTDGEGCLAVVWLEGIPVCNLKLDSLLSAMDYVVKEHSGNPDLLRDSLTNYISQYTQTDKILIETEF